MVAPIELTHNVTAKYVASSTGAHTPASLLCLQGRTRVGHTCAHCEAPLAFGQSSGSDPGSGWSWGGLGNAKGLAIDDGRQAEDVKDLRAVAHMVTKHICAGTHDRSSRRG